MKSMAAVIAVALGASSYVSSAAAERFRSYSHGSAYRGAAYHGASHRYYYHGRYYNNGRYYPHRYYAHNYNRHYYNNYCYHCGHGYPYGVGVAGFAAGALIGSVAAAPYYAPAYYAPGGYGAGQGTQAWLEYCSSKYRSFDARSGTYMGYDGHRHVCH
jgi:hypothetical protein